jgi:hypothetical protein
VDPAYDQTKDDPESWNLYNYVTNNPVTHTDPDGRQPALYVDGFLISSGSMGVDMLGGNSPEKTKDGNSGDATTKDGTSTGAPSDPTPKVDGATKKIANSTPTTGKEGATPETKTSPAQTGAESKNALTAVDRLKLVDGTKGDYKVDQNKNPDRAVDAQMRRDKTIEVTSTTETFKKDVASPGDKVVVIHARHPDKDGTPANGVIKPGTKTAFSGGPIHISGSTVWIVGCHMNQRGSERLFTFDKGAVVYGVSADLGLNRGVRNALISYEGGWVSPSEMRRMQ